LERCEEQGFVGGLEAFDQDVTLQLDHLSDWRAVVYDLFRVEEQTGVKRTYVLSVLEVVFENVLLAVESVDLSCTLHSSSSFF